MESTPKRFEDRQSAAGWLAATFRPWLASLTAAERSAVFAYKHNAYEDLNEALRAGYEADEMVARLDSALARFRLPEPIIVYRAASAEMFVGLRRGSEFVDFGFVSTSLLRVVANDFAFEMGADEAAVAEILVPGGTTVGAFVGAPDLVRDLGELEILLPRESRFRLVTVQPHTIEMEVVLNE